VLSLTRTIDKNDTVSWFGHISHMFTEWHVWSDKEVQYLFDQNDLTRLFFCVKQQAVYMPIFLFSAIIEWNINGICSSFLI